MTKPKRKGCLAMGNASEKPQHLASKLLAIRQRLGLSQSQLLANLGATCLPLGLANTKREHAFSCSLMRRLRVRVEVLIDDDKELKLPKNELLDLPNV